MVCIHGNLQTFHFLSLVAKTTPSSRVIQEIHNGKALFQCQTLLNNFQPTLNIWSVNITYFTRTRYVQFSLCRAHDISLSSPAYQVKITPLGLAFHSKLLSLSKHLWNYCLFSCADDWLRTIQEVIGWGNGLTKSYCVLVKIWFQDVGRCRSQLHMCWLIYVLTKFVWVLLNTNHI